MHVSSLPPRLPAGPDRKLETRVTGEPAYRQVYDYTHRQVTLVVGALPAMAASTNPNLGPPTNTFSANPYFPLSGFQKTGPDLRSHGLPELLWIGTAWLGDPDSDWERWPVIKALEQFGTFSNLVPARPVCGKPQY